MGEKNMLLRMKAIANQLDKMAEELTEQGENTLSDICTECAETLKEAVIEAS